MGTANSNSSSQSFFPFLIQNIWGKSAKNTLKRLSQSLSVPTVLNPKTVILVETKKKKKNDASNINGQTKDEQLVCNG